MTVTSPPQRRGPAIDLASVHDGQTAIVTINRPHRRNALDSQTLAELHQLLDQIQGRTDIRAVVLTGAGGTFCAGADIKAAPEDFTNTAATPAAGFLGAAQSPIGITFAAQELMASAFEKIHRLRQPVIAAIDGPALGGGFALALACDIRIASADATFGAVFIRHGVSACDMGTSYHLPRLVGGSRAAELMLTGRVFDAAEALGMGLVVDVVPADRLPDSALEKAREIANNAPLAVWMTKETMWQTIDAPSLRHALDLENRTQVMCSASGEIMESFAAFRDGGQRTWKPL
ncbi:enoyl-CoA hydratase/isomerase family protein [Mycobacterium terramassiliense]|uniref:Enoyl-CoA hydratase/carnithine racemase n=1 Tax=Mycobacterium terramassiliense TaxID=1841859 RepID=A0A2U3NGC8_9MYCO|nr:enoyl-CoA hydratase/isomerase family protein [Mycobacterium terramassiliense]SPM30578.1 Enoyl-CoA hydratase/carnithine racemase [Mycobacterium terramassiliense]